MSGTIVSIGTKMGQKVAQGEKLLSIEAMKMEMAVVANRDGIVRSVRVKAGDRVAANVLLLELDQISGMNAHVDVERCS